MYEVFILLREGLLNAEYIFFQCLGGPLLAGKGCDLAHFARLTWVLDKSAGHHQLDFASRLADLSRLVG